MRSTIHQYPDTSDNQGCYLPTPEEIEAAKKMFWEAHLEAMRQPTSPNQRFGAINGVRRVVHKKPRSKAKRK